jgi:putative transposase
MEIPHRKRCKRYDRNRWTPATIHEKIAYIHHNPVRRELVGVPELWPWSSARAWATGEDLPVPIDRALIPPCVPEGG